MILPSRRGFLSAIPALLLAPAIVRAESLMKISVPQFASLHGMHFTAADDGLRIASGAAIERCEFTDVAIVQRASGGFVLREIRNSGVFLQIGERCRLSVRNSDFRLSEDRQSMSVGLWHWPVVIPPKEGPWLSP